MDDGVDPVEEREEVEWRQAEEEAEDLGAEVGRRVVEVVGGRLVEVWLGREPQDQPLQDSEEETADRQPRGIQMQVTRRAASPVFALMCLNFEMRQ